MNISWTILIVAHAAAAVACFVFGLLIINPDRAKKYAWLSSAFIACLFAMVAFVVGAMISHWNELSIVERSVFSGLVVLGLYMSYRGLRARRLLRTGMPPVLYIKDVGFTLIALFNGFSIVGLIDLKAPPWLVVIGAVAAIIIGNRLLVRAERRYGQRHDVG